MRAALLVLLACCVFASPRDSGAQESKLLREGVRVRLWASPLGSKPISGTITRLDETSLAFRPSGGDTTSHNVLRAELVRIQVSTGKRPQMLKGALIGVGCGVALGALIALTTEPTGSGSWFFDETESIEVFWGAIVFGSTGLVVGSLTGLAARTDRWRDLPGAVGLDDRSGRAIPSLAFSLEF